MTVEASAERPTVRTFGVADLAGLDALFQRVWPGSLPFAAWAYSDNPLGVPTLVGAELAGEVVGARGAIRWPITDGGGEEQVVYQVGGTCVDPRLRRSGLFTSMTRLFLEHAESDGCTAIYNVSVPAVRPGYEKLGWTYLDGFRGYYRPTNPVRLARNATSRDRPEGGFDAATVDFDRVAPFLAAREKRLSGRWHSRYDPDVFRWRFSRPGHRLVGNAEVGYAVYRLRSRGAIREALVGDLWPGVRGVGPLIREVVRCAQPDVVTIWASRRHPMLTSLRRRGFAPIPGRSFNFGVRTFSAEGDGYLDADRWALMAADIDTF